VVIRCRITSFNVGAFCSECILTWIEWYLLNRGTRWKRSPLCARAECTAFYMSLTRGIRGILTLSKCGAKSKFILKSTSGIWSSGWIFD
jgi:hypothetical protein